MVAAESSISSKISRPCVDGWLYNVERGSTVDGDSGDPVASRENDIPRFGTARFGRRAIKTDVSVAVENGAGVEHDAATIA